MFLLNDLLARSVAGRAQGYVPLNKERRQSTLERKRQEYRECVAQYFGPDNTSGPTPLDTAVFHQVRVKRGRG